MEKTLEKATLGSQGANYPMQGRIEALVCYIPIDQKVEEQKQIRTGTEKNSGNKPKKLIKVLFIFVLINTYQYLIWLALKNRKKQLKERIFRSQVLNLCVI